MDNIVMGVAERRARQKKELRAEILDAARELFAREGVENVSMRKVAARIEYSPTTIYLYFKDKAELLDSLCEETFAKLSGKIERVVARHAGDPGEALVAGLKEYVRFGLKHPDHYRVTFMISCAGGNESEPLPGGSLALKTYDFLRQGVMACLEAGVFPALDVELASQALWCTAHGLTANLIASPTFPWAPRERLIDYTLRAAVRGLRAEG